MSQKLHLETSNLEERNNNIVSLYQKGSYSYNSLSRIFHVSPQRIAQIIKKAKNHAKYERSKEIKEFSDWADKRADEIGKNLPK